MSLVIGLTGGIASGKSTISNILKEMRFTVIDADMEARIAVEPGKEAYQKIVHYFGENILLQDGHIDRTKLGKIIFNNKEQREILNSIVHPAVRKQMITKRDMAIARQESIIVLDIPLLFESNLTSIVDKTILVYVDRSIQVNRLMNRNNLTKEEANARIDSQMPLSEKIKLADAIIDNNSTIENSKKQLLEILNSWSKS